ncbi:MAG: GntR family transcriptional regulator [Bacillota bacterium]|nr:GntR family transcriptional regulator [Bacillota bacterium]
MTTITKERQIRTYLIGLISSPDLDRTEKLPSENQIAEKFATSRHTVRKVYESLEELGMVYSQQGIGRFPIKERPEINLALTGTSFSQKMEEQNIPLQTLNIGVRKLKDRELEKFWDLGLQGQVYEISRLRILHNIPAAIHRSYLSSENFPNIEEEGQDILSIHAYYRSKGLKDFKHSSSTLSISWPSLRDIEVLSCGSLVPLLVLEGKLYDQEGRLIEIIKTKYRSDLFKYSLE